MELCADTWISSFDATSTHGLVISKRPDAEALTFSSGTSCGFTDTFDFTLEDETGATSTATIYLEKECVAEYITGETSTELIAAQNYDAGGVNAYIDGENLIVDIYTQSPWSQLYKEDGTPDTSLYVGTTAPTQGNPGGFPYQGETTYTIPLSDLSLSCEDNGATIYFAVHSNVYRDGDTSTKQTAWGQGDPIGTGWSMYFKMLLSCDKTCPCD